VLAWVDDIGVGEGGDSIGLADVPAVLEYFGVAVARAICAAGEAPEGFASLDDVCPRLVVVGLRLGGRLVGE
jgi:hypothetical protein